MNNKIKYFKTVFFSILYCFSSFASNTDEKTFTYCDSLVELTRAIAANDEFSFDEKTKEIDKVLDIVLESDSAKHFNCVLRPKIILLFQTGNLDLALAAEQQVLQLSKKYNLKGEIITSRNNLNIINYQLGNLDSALHYLNLNYEDLKSSDNIFAKGANLNGLTIYFIRAKQFDKALKYLQQLQELGEKENHKEVLKNAAYNWVNYYKGIEDYEKAISYAEKYIETYGKQLSVLNELGLIYKKQEDYDKSIAAFKNTLEIIPANNNFGLAAVNNNIGTVYNRKKEYKQAISYLEKGLQFSKIANSSSFIEVAFDELAIAYKGLKNFEKSLHFTEKLYELRDSIQSIEVKERIANLENAAELNEKNAELQLAETEKQLKEAELSAKNKQIFIAFFVLLVVVAFLVYAVILNRKLQQTKKALEISNNTKDKFFSIIAHDLRSPIIALQGIGKRLIKHIEKQNLERVERLAPELDKSLGNVNFLLDNLLNWAVSQQGNIPLKIEKINVDEIIKEVVSSSEIMAKAKEVSIKVEVDNFEVEADYNSLSLILRNLLSNAIKFSPEKGEVAILAKNNAQKSIAIIDQGKGIDGEQLEKIKKSIYFSDAKEQGEKGFGLGLNLVHQFANLNKLKLKIDSEIDKGSNFSVVFN